MPFHTHRLPNGLTLIGETIPTARSVSVGFFTLAGARDETAPESGVSHFLEHMVFKGTQRRSALEVNRDFDRIGASYNAYTSEEMTVFYAAVLPEYLSQAVDILADILRPSLRDEDFATEKQVILEEIKMYEDQAGSMAWDNARKLYFGAHPLGQSILGSTESITALERDTMHAYFGKKYVGGNITIAVAGAFDWSEFVRMAERHCSEWPSGAGGRGGLTEHNGPGGVYAVAKEGTAQEHVLCLATSASAESEWRYAASTLSIAIGDDSGSRLHWQLVDPGRVESAACGIDPSQGSGFLAATFTCDPESAQENLDITRKVLAEVQRDGITDEELEQAKNKIASRVVRASERPSGRMRSIAGAWVYNNEYSDPDVELARFDAVNQKKIREYLERYPIDKLTIIGYGPLAKLA
jgi:predicted Zn-dependent peptidase